MRFAIPPGVVNRVLVVLVRWASTLFFVQLSLYQLNAFEDYLGL